MKQIIFDGPFSVKFEEKAVTAADMPKSVEITAIVTGVSVGTERMWYDGTAPAITSGRRGYPYYPGYEFVGKVTAIGQDVVENPGSYPRLAGLTVGDTVFAFKPHADYQYINEGDMWAKVADDIEPADAAAIALTSTCVHAIHRANVEFGAKAAVVGFGGVGAMLAQALRAAGADVSIVSASPGKRRMAASLGFDQVYGRDDIGPIRDEMDVVFECTGRADGIAIALAAAGKQAKVVLAGFYVNDIVASGEEVFVKELTLLGVRSNGAFGQKGEFLRWPRSENIAVAADLIAKGHVKATPLVTHRVNAAEMADCYKMIAEYATEYCIILAEWD